LNNARKSLKLDEIDRKILFFLQANSRIPYHKIGKELKIAASTVHNRVKKMIETGVISRFAAIVDSQMLGLLVSWLGINVDPDKLESVVKELATYEEVQIVGTSYGDHDILVQVVCRSAKELSEFIRNKIKPISGVKEVPGVHSSIFTEIQKNVNWVPLKEGVKINMK
jgi:Lrp/AsnC family transcriptional regulator for asnA, asnC and gidA